MKKNKILSFLLVALASTSYAQEPAEISDVAPAQDNTATQIPVEQVAVNDDLASLDTLDDYAVTAYRFSTPQLDTPVNTTVITASDIAESFSTNIADVLQKKANVQFRSSTSGSAISEIAMRGYGEGSGQRVLVIIDGQRMNRQDLGAINWQQIPLEYIESIEVMRGSQSAMYGNNAVAGVIKINTKKGSKDDTYSASFSGGSYGMYGVNGLITGSYEDWSWSADIGRVYEDGYRENSYAWTNSYNLSASNQLSDALSLRVTANFAQSEFGMPDGLYLSDYNYDATQSYYLDNHYAFDEGVYTIALNSETDFGEGEVALSWSFRDSDYYMSDWGSYTRNQQWTLDFTPKYKFNLGDDANVIVGADFEYLKIDSDYDSASYWYSDDIAKIERLSIAPYIAGSATVAENFIFTAAARYEYTNTKGEGYSTYSNNFDDDLTNEGFAANIGVTYKINKNSSVYFRFDQIYRYPTTEEIASYNGYSMYTPFNVDLDPEHGQNYEIGYKYIDENWTVNANFFAQYLENEIYYTSVFDADWNWLGGINSNYDDPTLRYGFDYQIAYDDKYWGASLMGSVMKSEFIGGSYDGCDVPLVPNFTNTLIVYVKPIETFKLSISLSYVSSMNLMGDYAGDYYQGGNYFLLGFLAEIKVAECTTVYFGIENALDEDYVNYGSSWGTGSYDTYVYPGMGRVFKAGLNLTF